MPSVWNKKLVELLLSLYSQYENLYNINHPEYRDRNKRAEAINLISEKLKKVQPAITPELTKLKIHSLRCQFLKEKRDLAINNNGAEPKLWCYDHMEFLESFCNLRDTTINKSISSIKMENTSPNIQTRLNGKRSPSPIPTSSNSSAKKHPFDFSNQQSNDESHRSTMSISNILNKRTKLIVANIHEMQCIQSDHDDEIDVIGKLIVSKLRQIPNERLRNDASWKLMEVLREYETDLDDEPDINPLPDCEESIAESFEYASD